MKTKAIIVDDHTLFREGLCSLIEKKSMIDVVAQAGDGRTALALVRKLQPDVVIMDVKMPELNGIEATRRITSEFPETRVLALSMHSDSRFVSEILQAGASGYLLKECAFEELGRALDSIIEGTVYLSPKIAAGVVENFVKRQSKHPFSPFHALSDREREVLQLISEGKSTKQISEILFISVKTVESHKQNIMNKLNISSIAELTKYAIREGLTSI